MSIFFVFLFTTAEISISRYQAAVAATVPEINDSPCRTPPWLGSSYDNNGKKLVSFIYLCTFFSFYLICSKVVGNATNSPRPSATFNKCLGKFNNKQIAERKSWVLSSHLAPILVMAMRFISSNSHALAFWFCLSFMILMKLCVFNCTYSTVTRVLPSSPQ